MPDNTSRTDGLLRYRIFLESARNSSSTAATVTTSRWS